MTKRSFAMPFLPIFVFGYFLSKRAYRPFHPFVIKTRTPEKVTGFGMLSPAACATSAIYRSCIRTRLLRRAALNRVTMRSMFVAACKTKTGESVSEIVSTANCSRSTSVLVWMLWKVSFLQQSGHRREGVCAASAKNSFCRWNENHPNRSAFALRRQCRTCRNQKLNGHRGRG